MTPAEQIHATIKRSGKKKDIAAHIGLDPTAFSQIMTGKRRWTLQLIKGVADCLGAVHFLVSFKAYVFDLTDNLPGRPRSLLMYADRNLLSAKTSESGPIW